MSSRDWNAEARVTWFDRVLARTVLPVIPPRIRPNHFTVLRMLLTIPTIVLLWQEQYIAGIILFLVAGATDAIDGALARTRKQITEWGILFDPVADKLLIGSVLFLIVLRNVNFVLGFALLAAEAVLIIGGWIRKRRGVIQPADMWGKLKMCAEVLGILLLLVALASGADLFVTLSNGTLAVALVAALVTIFAKMV